MVVVLSLALKMVRDSPASLATHTDPGTPAGGGAAVWLEGVVAAQPAMTSGVSVMAMRAANVWMRVGTVGFSSRIAIRGGNALTSWWRAPISSALRNHEGWVLFQSPWPLDLSAAQSKGVHDHRDAGQAHRCCSDHGRQHESGEWIQDAGCDRDAQGVVEEREAQVLLHVGHRGPGHRASGGDASQVALDQRDRSGVDGDVAAGAHSDSDVGLRQRGSIVDAITCHRHQVALLLQVLDDP